MLVRVKEAVESTVLGVQGLEQALRTCSKGGDTISEDMMMVAFNRLNVEELRFDDIRDFFSSVKSS